MDISCQVTFPLPKKISTNRIYAGEHWAIRKSHKDLYEKAFRDYVPQFIPSVTPVHLRFDFQFKSRPLDPSNTSYMAKMLEDLMVSNGIIPDDTASIILSVTLTSKKGPSDMVVITVG